MPSHWLTERLRGWGDRPSIVWCNETWSFARLCDVSDVWSAELARLGIAPGCSLGICGDYSPQLCALLLAAVRNRNIVVPLASATARRWDSMMEVAGVGFAVKFDGNDTCQVTEYDRAPTHPLLRQIVERDVPGLILFSSGSSGESKASVLDFEKLLEKFRDSRPAYRTLVFLTLDHIGGINTLFHVLCHGGTVVTTRERTPEAVCAAVEAHAIQLLPTTPTFLRMLLIADAAKLHDLTSLEIITYGTEPMPASTLAAVREAFPWVRLKQTYGLSELGILPTRSRSSDSLWLKLGAAGFEHKIVDGMLWIRSPTAMLGYLNAPSPIDADGWLNTQDLVEQDGDYIRILGRKSELINVGGEKVHPSEVENVLLRLDNVKDVTVSGKPNPITGEVVSARITLIRSEDPAAAKQRIRKSCQTQLERHKVPAVIEIVEEDQHGPRFKKSRKAAAHVDARAIR